MASKAITQNDLKNILDGVLPIPPANTLLLDKSATGTYPVSDISNFTFLLFVGCNSDLSTVLVTSFIPVSIFNQVRMTWTVNGSTATLDAVIDRASNTSLTISSLTSSRRVQIYGIK